MPDSNQSEVVCNTELSPPVIRSMIPGVHSKNNNARNLALYYVQVRGTVQSNRT